MHTSAVSHVPVHQNQLSARSRFALGDAPAHFRQLAPKAPTPLINFKQKARFGTRSGTRRRKGEIVSQGGSGSSLYRTLVAEVTFHRPCAPEECALGALWPSQNSFARTCVVNTILACTLGLDSQPGAPCKGSGSSLHRTCVADVTFYRTCPPEQFPRGVPLAPPDQFRTHLCSRYHFRVYPGA